MSPANRAKDSSALPPSTDVELLTEPLRGDHPVADFRSGERELDEFLRRHALKNEGPVSRTFVLLSTPDLPAEAPPLAGFYALAMQHIKAETAAPHLDGRKLPRYPLGVALLARLAVDERLRGRGLGKTLLFDALLRVRIAAAQLGCAGIVVDAKHEVALDFYLHFGFRDVGDAGVWPRRMFLPFSLVDSLFAG